ncbi:MAG: alpha/beta fold hydrolase [Proteobacteria bacterium]|nr:alpha/beta fold hydrolase [Pseudomonadota bacterium]
MKNILRLSGVLLLIAFESALAQEMPFVALGDESPIGVAGLSETEYRLTTASGQSVGLHRFRDTRMAPRAVVLYLPGTNMNGTLKSRDERENLWLYLAGRGVPVFTLDYRTRFVPHDYPGELTFMLDWTVEQFVADALLAATQVRQMLPDTPLFVAGFSRGALYAYALAGQIELDGLIALDGSFKSIPYEPFDMAAAMARFDQAGKAAIPLSRRGYERRELMMRTALENPTGPASDERFATAAEQLSAVLYNAWGPGVLSNTRGEISSLETLIREMLAYDWFFPAVQNVEGQSIRVQENDPMTRIDDHFGSVDIPVLYFGSSRMGPGALIAGIHSASALGKGEAEIHVLEDYGHLDVLFSRRAVADVFQVIDRWLTANSNRTASE